MPTRVCPRASRSMRSTPHVVQGESQPDAAVEDLQLRPGRNLLSKSDVGNYSYPAPGSARPHAVSSITGGTISTSFTYDANGNQISGLGRTITYSSYNKPASISQGTTTLGFNHDFD